FGRPGRIEVAPCERPMVDLLLDGGLDALFTPFMPKGFFDQESPLRQVLDDFRAAEVAYLNEVGGRSAAQRRSSSIIQGVV
ncbi:hypothetical protein AB9F45_38520, partial [Rhizobium leguminosarum]